MPEKYTTLSRTLHNEQITKIFHKTFKENDSMKERRNEKKNTKADSPGERIYVGNKHKR